MASKRHATVAAERSSAKSRTTSAVRGGRFARGAKVKVRLGARFHSATVVEERNGRFHVEIHVEGADEPITSSYTIDELTSDA